MFVNIRLLTILTVLNLLATTGVGLWVYTNHNSTMDVDDLEDLLQELSEDNPHFLVSLLNEAAKESTEIDEEALEGNILKNRDAILKAGFSIKPYKNSDQKTLVIFADLADAYSLTYLKNVQTALSSINCSVHIIPVSIFGEKSTEQAKIITAASLQNVEKAFQLALTYNPVEGAENHMMKASEKLGFDMARLSKDIQAVVETVANQTKMAEDLMVPGAPSMFLLTTNEAYFLLPVEAQDLPNLIEHPRP